MLTVRRLGYALGAEISGIDLTTDLDVEVVAEIRQLWLRYIVLCFPGQPLEAQELSRFAGRFGKLDDHRRIPDFRHPEYDTVGMFISKPITYGSKAYAGNRAEFWHTDLSHTDQPTMATFLNAKQLPEIGGNTIFANQYLAYETLSPTLKEMIGQLEGVHDVSYSLPFTRESPEAQAERKRLNPPIAHPAVRIHPETQRKTLYLGERVRQFVGMTEEESRPLLDFLNAHATRYEFTYRHAWRADDLLMWDNRCALHFGVQDYDHEQLRLLLRCSVMNVKSGWSYVAPSESTIAAT